MKCCICKEKIKKEINGWDRGNNALPIKDGRCCNKCNYTIVIPARFYQLQKLQDGEKK